MFWLLDQQNPGSGIYNTARVFQISDALDPAILNRSLWELLQRHDVLRVRFAHTENGPVQVVRDAAPPNIELIDLRNLTAAARERIARTICLETVLVPFDLAVGPLMRAKLLQMNEKEWRLCLAIHHAVSDGFTGGILLNELGAIYDALASDMPNPLPPLALHFTDYA